MKPAPIWVNDDGNIRIYKSKAGMRSIFYRKDSFHLLAGYSVYFPELYFVIERGARDCFLAGIPRMGNISGESDSVIIESIDFCNIFDEGSVCLGRNIQSISDRDLLEIFWASEFNGIISAGMGHSDDPSEKFRLFSEMSLRGNPPTARCGFKFKCLKALNNISLYNLTISEFIEAESETLRYVSWDGFSRLLLRKVYFKRKRRIICYCCTRNSRFDSKIINSFDTIARLLLELASRGIEIYVSAECKWDRCGRISISEPEFISDSCPNLRRLELIG